jgi:hypothetical protein
LTIQIQQFKPVVKDRLFYDRYEYCFGFTLAEATVLRGLKHDLIDARLDQRIEWREMARKRWKQSMDTMGWNLINDQVREDLHSVCDTIITSGTDCKIAVSHHVGYLYTNDLSVIEQLRNLKYKSGLPLLSNMRYTRALVNRPKNTVLLKKSLYKRRSYFNYIRLTPQEKENIRNFFDHHQGHIRMSPSLNEFLHEKPYQRTVDHYFIDYNDEQWLTMLALIRPGLIRKTQDIVTK